MQARMEAMVFDWDEIVEDISESLVDEVGAPEGASVYVLWGFSPFDLETALYDLLMHLGEEERALFRRYLGDLVETIHREGYNILALLPHEGQLHAKGGSVPIPPGWETETTRVLS